MQILTTWAKKLIKLDNNKNLRFKKRGIGIEWSANCSLVKKEHEQVKIKGYAGTDGNFLSHVHYRDPYFDFREHVHCTCVI